MPAANFIQDFHETVSPPSRSQQRSPSITTERNEMQITLPIVPFERVAHQGKTKTRTLKTEGCGTPAYTLDEVRKWYANLACVCNEQKASFAPPAMQAKRDASPISIKINFAGSKTPGDNLLFADGQHTCSEGLGLKDCTSTSGYRLWNLEGNGRVYNDASEWTVAVSVEYHFRGLYHDNNNRLQPFSCTTPFQPDGPLLTFLQQPAGQKSIFYLDAPGPYFGEDPSDLCLGGPNLIDSETFVFNFQVDFKSKLSSFHKTVYYFVQTVIAPDGILDTAKSRADYGNLSLDF